MKVLRMLLATAACAFGLHSAANPIAPPMMLHELILSPGSWIIETGYSDISFPLDGYFITTLSDTAYLNPGFEIGSYGLITPSDLQSPLSIDPAGDVVAIHDPFGNLPPEELRFGAVADPRIAAPLPGQSICATADFLGMPNIYYLDNSPTPGAANDSLNAIGFIEGFISDANGLTLANVEIRRGTASFYSNDSGYFRINGIASIDSVTFAKPNYRTQTHSWQIWPEDTVSVTITLAFDSVDYPLHVGDLWQYQEWIFLLTKEAVGEVVLNNGIRYMQIDNSNNPGYPEYQRTVGNRVYRYHGWRQQDELFFDFNAMTGDTIASIPDPNSGDTTDIVLIWTGMGNVFGNLRRQWEFFEDVSRQSVDDELWHTVSEGFGVTSFYGAWVDYSLRGAIINGVQYGTISGIAAGSDQLPKEFALLPNFPNPFNPETVIRYQLSVISEVDLSIYNLLGQKIVTLVRERQPAGSYRITWNGRDAAGAALSSGIYICRLRAGDRAQSRKMVLLR